MFFYKQHSTHFSQATYAPNLFLRHALSGAVLLAVLWHHEAFAQIPTYADAQSKEQSERGLGSKEEFARNTQLAPGFKTVEQRLAPGFGNNSLKEQYAPESLNNSNSASPDKEAARSAAIQNMMTQLNNKPTTDAAREEQKNTIINAGTAIPSASEFDKDPAPIFPNAEEEKTSTASDAPEIDTAQLAAPLPALPNDISDAEDTKSSKKKSSEKVERKRMPTHNYRTQMLPDAISKDQYISADNRYLPKVLRWSQLDTEMFKAARIGDIDAMRALFGRGISVNIYNQRGESLISLAARYGQTNAVHWLVVRGARVNDPNAQGQTPLHIAASRGDAKMMQALLDAGADPYTPDANGASIAQYAASTRNPAVENLLKEYGAL